MIRPTSDRRTARLVDHAAPPTPGEWLENDARYFADVEAEIQRRAEGGEPEEAPWASPLYFDAATHDGSLARRALLSLRHLPHEAVTRVCFLSEALRGKCGRPKSGPGAHPLVDVAAAGEQPAHHARPPARTRRKEATTSPPARGGRTIVAPLDSAEALAG
ncbi:hypothetical protein ACIBBD_09190 [Streptomyces sp. NPDC051315]|uniref:hypothetical protein n=1 Tax=Streptomyces sp. NPDC051315 TaxID=3365650 RepID=UPI0037BD1831